MSNLYKNSLDTHTVCLDNGRIWEQVLSLFSGFNLEKDRLVVQALVQCPFSIIPLVLGHMTFPIAPPTGSWSPLCHPIKKILESPLVHVSCGVARSSCFYRLLFFMGDMLSCLVWTRDLWVFSLAACLCPVLHMAGDLFCWPRACVFVLCEHMALS